MRWPAVLALPLFLSSAALSRETYEAKPALEMPGGLILFYQSEGPLSYESLLRREVPPGVTEAGPVATESCQYGLAVPLSLSPSRISISAAAGNGGFEKALQRLREKHPDLLGVHDVMVDMHTTSVL